jgi:membrane-bound lytic murein transglycosylase D
MNCFILTGKFSFKTTVIAIFFYSIHSASAQDSIKNYTDIFFEYHFAQLDKKTPLNIEYNALVRKYIQRYIEEKPRDVARFIGLSKYYFPIFEYYLDKYDLPLELKYLSVVESGLDPFAKSSSGAVGLWQFLYNSADMFDLTIDSYIDERRDVYKSTEAACRYFRYLYQTFNDWHLVLAAYNGGPGVVRNAVERSGGKTNLWEILPYMPEQTQNYVPAFLAMNYLMNNNLQHNIYPSDTSLMFQDMDTLMVDYQVNFQQISETLHIPITLLRLLNPAYKLDLIPETGKKHLLVLPQTYIQSYLKYENIILTNDTSRLKKQMKTNKLIYNVEKGDFLHKIAIKFNCNPQDIKAWNNLSSDFIAPGQTLVIWVSN